EVEEYCDTVFVINKGRLIASGHVKDILRPHERVVRVVFEGPLPDNEALGAHERIRRVTSLAPNSLEITLTTHDSAWLNEHLVRGGYRVAAIRPKEKTLKEFFLSVTGDDSHA
ncbi:MAG: hypothetical protein JSW27_05895, partial [Phycisphaerales bacterium]